MKKKTKIDPHHPFIIVEDMLMYEITGISGLFSGIPRRYELYSARNTKQDYYKRNNEYIHTKVQVFWTMTA